jgi:hypothetical protein
MGLADTAPQIRRRQLEVYRAMSPQRRVEIALSMSEETRGVAVGGIRTRDASLDEEGVRHVLLRILHGARLAAMIRASRPRR